MLKALCQNWRKLLLLGALVIFGLMLYKHRQEMVQVQTILHSGQWGFFVLALLLQLCFYLCQAYMYKEIIGVCLSLPFWEIFSLTLNSNTTNKLIPSGGVSGLFAFMDRAKDKGVASELSILSNMWFYILDYLSFLLIVWWGAVYYSMYVGMHTIQVIAVAIFSAIILLVSIFLVWVMRNMHFIEGWLERNRSRRFIRRLYNPLHRIIKQMRLLKERWLSMKAAILHSFLAALLMQLFDLFILYLCFIIVRYPVHWGMVVAGFGLASVLAMVSMVPQGIGIYEASMTWVYIQMGVPFSVAVTVALLYRAVTFWFAIVPGLFTLNPGKKVSI